MPEESPSYVERAADRQLLDSLLAGKYCYVLNSRQMGKSSMCVRTKLRLEQEGVRTAFVDLTKIGGRNVSADQWYAGLTVEVGRSLDLRNQLLAYWKENGHLSPMQRFFGGLREVVLEQTSGPIVVFVDEIDATRSLAFDTDEFFAGIRECHNRRVHDPAYKRLSFCLLGVAVPSDLIRNAHTTPFNVGERVYLRDFTLEEAGALAKGLPGRESLVQRVHYWTNGHPFLTQSLCTALRNDPTLRTEKDVDALVARDLFEPKARDTNINLADVGNRVLNGYAEGDDVNQFRADILSAYEKALKGKDLADDESNRITAILKLSGLMRSEGKSLKVRNRIYERVFDRAWIVENMPAQEIRRQHRAFWLGVLRTAAIGALVIALVGNLAYRNDQLRAEAARQRDRANYEVYVSDMSLMPLLWQRGDIERMRSLLYSTEGNGARGWEWDLWNRLSHESIAELNQKGRVGLDLSPDGREIILPSGNEIQVVDSATFKVLRSFPALPDTSRLAWFPDGRRFAELSRDGRFTVRDAETGKSYGSLAGFAVGVTPAIRPDGKVVIGTSLKGIPLQADLTTMTLKPIPFNAILSFGEQYTSDGRTAIWAESAQGVGGAQASIVVRESATWKVLRSWPVVGQLGGLLVAPDGKHLALAMVDGTLQYWNIESAKLLWKVQAQERDIMTIAFSKDGKRLVTTGRDRHVNVLEISEIKAKHLRSFSDGLNAALSPDGSRLFVGYWTLRAYDLTRPANPVTVATPTESLFSQRVIAKDHIALVASLDRKVWAVDLADPKPPKPVEGIPGPVVGTATYHPWVFFESNGKLGVFDLTSHSAFARVDVKPDVQDFYVDTPDGSTLLRVTFTEQGLWDLKTGKKKTDLPFPGIVNRPSFSPDGKWLAEGMNDGRVSMIDLKTNLEHKVTAHLAPVWQILFSKDGQKMITASDDDSAAMLDVATGKVLVRFQGHSQTVRDADISPDGRRIVTASDDQTVRVWDAKNGRELTSLEGYKGPVFRARFSEDGKSIYTLTRAGVVTVWSSEAVEPRS